MTIRDAQLRIATPLNRSAGFTFIELMVTVAVAIIVLSIAIPSFIDVVRSNKLTSRVNEYVQAFHLARNEALRSGGATICASKDTATCSSTDWRDGWIIFSDLDSDGTLDPGEDVVKVGEGAPTGVTITSSATAITFGRNGFLSPAGSSLTLKVCGGRTGAGAGRTITVTSTGRPNTDPYDSCA